MRTREPVPDRSYGDDYPEQVPLGQLPGLERGLGSRPSLTIAEAARLCGVSVSTIRCYLAAGRFPTAHQQPSPIPGLVLAVKPTKVLAFGKGEFSHTRYRPS